MNWIQITALGTSCFAFGFAIAGHLCKWQIMELAQ